MIVVDWNISYLHSTGQKIQYLKEIVSDNPYVIILQEVVPTAYIEVQKAFVGKATVEYSLNYRKPGKYDNQSRMLGVAIIISKEFHLLSAGVLERTLLPDRTLWTDISYDGKDMRVFGLHSITGCDHKKAKELQYYSFAECIDTMKPDIIGIDANEPQKDHFDFNQMVFFDNHLHGNGCRTFFTAAEQNGLKDAYVINYDTDNYVQDMPLTTSHVIQRGAKKVRYDFLLVNQKKLGSISCRYEYDNAVQHGSDHAAIIAEV